MQTAIDAKKGIGRELKSDPLVPANLRRRFFCKILRMQNVNDCLHI
jgi:hypothetical protein